MCPGRAASIPELDLRLEEHRGAIINGVAILRRRVRRDAGDWAPLTLMRRHSGAVLATAGLAGLVFGYATGRLLSMFR